MADILEVLVPEGAGDDGVDLVEILVAPGDRVGVDDSLVTLESDKASMEVPAPAAGVVQALRAAEGDSVKEGQVLLTLEVDAEADASAEPDAVPAEGATPEATTTAAESAPTPEAAPASTTTGKADVDADVTCDLMVLGSGPGGYSAAFRAADLGLKVVVVERYPILGGVCLNVGCIPSKALLHIAALIDDTRHAKEHGVTFGEPSIDLDQLREWKGGVVSRLTGGLASMAKQRGVEVVTGTGTLTGPHQIDVEDADGKVTTVGFDQAILAAGSQSVRLPGFPYDDDRLVDSTGALELRDVPNRLLVIGGGIIGLEMATVYHALGSEIVVVELAEQIMPGTDKDLVRPLLKRLEARYAGIWTRTKVVRLESVDDGLRAFFESDHPKLAVPESAIFDRVLLSVGRSPNGRKIGAEAAGVAVDDRGFVPVDRQMRTNVPHIFAIGDLVGQPMLAHKAVHEGHVAAEVAAGEPRFFDARVIPSVAYTNPEVAWVGLTETQAKAEGIAYEKGVFPWSASGRSLAQGRDEGSTKLLFDPKTKTVLGGGIVGSHAGDLIAEIALAIEMGADAHDIGLTIHPHPTLSESVGMAAEAFEGTITDLYLPKQRKAAKARE